LLNVVAEEEQGQGRVSGVLENDEKKEGRKERKKQENNRCQWMKEYSQEQRY